MDKKDCIANWPGDYTRYSLILHNNNNNHIGSS